MPVSDRTVAGLLRSAARRISTCLSGQAGGSGETPYLDAVVLLSHAMGTTTERLFASLHDLVDPAAARAFGETVEMRCSGMPVSYIRGFKEFYGREFTVSPAVLVPRPETEVLVEAALDEVDRMGSSETIHLHDCCTGSGCVAVTLAAERPLLSVSGSDISGDALAVARKNAASLLTRPLPFYQGDCLSGLPPDAPVPQIVTANPPYLADSEVETLLRAGWPEPAVALSGGPSGLQIVARLVAQAGDCMAGGGTLMLEIGAGQGADVKELLQANGFIATDTRCDLSGVERVIVARKAGP